MPKNVDSESVKKLEKKLAKAIKKNKSQKAIDKAKARLAAAQASSSPAPAGTLGDAGTAAWRAEHKMELVWSPGAEPIAAEPYTEFSAVTGMPKKLLSAATKGFTRPTPIQAQAWPLLCQPAERDVVGIAETGSGKTLAFGLPGLARVARGRAAGVGGLRNRCSHPQMLVLAPTRELARQSAEVLTPAGAAVSATVLTVYGGVPKHTQVDPLTTGAGVDIVVATPGRLVDLLNDGYLSLDQVHMLVLDEADRMLDMGFEREVRQLASLCGTALPADWRRQTAMFSATWPMEIRSLASEFMTKPARIVIGTDSLQANARVSQQVEVFDNERARGVRLKQLLAKEVRGKKGPQERIIVFALYKKEAARLHKMLESAGYNAGLVSGDCSQAAREQALAEFKSNTTPILVATDVAARGLDIPNVELVINFSFPLTIEDYVHRIGRTGRAGKTGRSITFFHQGDKAHAGELVNVLKQAEQPVPTDLTSKFQLFTKRKAHSMYGDHYNPDVDTSNVKRMHVKF